MKTLIILLIIITCSAWGQNVPYCEIDLCQGNSYTGGKGFSIMYEFKVERQGWLRWVELLVNDYPMREEPVEAKVMIFKFQGNKIFYDKVYESPYMEFPIDKLPEYKVHAEVWDRILIRVDYKCKIPVASPELPINLPNGRIWHSFNGKHWYPLANYHLWMTYDTTL